MAKKYDLSSLQKRDVLNETVASLDALRSWGEHYEEVGSLYDAVDFYEKAGAADGLGRVRLRAKEAGNVFLFQRVCRITGYEPGREEWISLADIAKKLGKLTFAAEAYQCAGVQELEGDSAQETEMK
jgi:aspartate/tyrosine/aromatic aminotransferase